MAGGGRVAHQVIDSRPGYLARPLPEVVENCRRAGLVVQRELIAVGIIIGSIDENSVSVLTQIEGVRAVERERTNWGLD